MNIDPEHFEVVKRYLNEVPVKLAALARDLGLEVFKSPLSPKISGLIEPSETAKAGFRIKINRYEMLERQRFTLAHEIAHFLLHRDKIGGGVFDNVMYRSNLSSKYEVEANRLAAELIMPDNMINKEREKLGEISSDEIIVLLSEIFHVSQPAMRIRLVM